MPVMPPMNAVGMNTAVSTSAMAISAAPTSFMVTRAASVGRQAFAQLALDVLDDDDRVVDHDADGEHQPEQRQHVDGEAEPLHHREGADQRHGDGDERDDRRPPRLQEQQHDDDDERARPR